MPLRFAIPIPARPLPLTAWRPHQHASRPVVPIATARRAPWPGAAWAGLQPLLMACALVVLPPAAALAQTPPDPQTAAAATPRPVPAGEDVEPRVIGTPGTVTLGVAGHLDRAFSTEDFFTTNYTAHVDASYFLTRKLVVRAGLAGSGALGGDDDSTMPVGTGAPALRGFAGALYYFTPRSIWSVYTGADYWGQLTQRTAGDHGMAVGTLGLQAAISSRVSVFAEYGYGLNLSRGADGEAITRMLGRVGVRLRIRQ